jgi:hypothetical protein
VTARLRGQRRARPHRTSRGCPTCGHAPTAAAEAEEQRLDLQIVWLTEDPDQPDQPTVQRFTAQCQPRVAVYAIACRACGDVSLLTGVLAEAR